MQQASFVCLLGKSIVPVSSSPLNEYIIAKKLDVCSGKQSEVVGRIFIFVTFYSVSVEAKLSFIEPGRRWAHSPSSGKAPGISYQYQENTPVFCFA